VWRNFGWRFGVGTLVLSVAKGRCPRSPPAMVGPVTVDSLHRGDVRSRLPRPLLGFGGGRAWPLGACAELALFTAGAELPTRWPGAPHPAVFLGLRYGSLGARGSATFTRRRSRSAGLGR